LHALRGSPITLEGATEEALQQRADLASAAADVKAAEAMRRAERAQRLPVLALNANYGGGGPNAADFTQVYEVAGSVSVPIYTGGWIAADIEQAEADLERRRAEYEDLHRRVAYDVRFAWLDVNASQSSVAVAAKNRDLAGRALGQSQDRYLNGVTNYLEAVQAQAVVAAAEENYIESCIPGTSPPSRSRGRWVMRRRGYLNSLEENSVPDQLQQTDLHESTRPQLVEDGPRQDAPRRPKTHRTECRFTVRRPM
jgi:hypothetical protein